MDNWNNKFRFDNIFFDSPLELEHFVIYQAGDLFCEYDTEVDNHRHFCYELSFIVSGQGFFTTNAVTTKVFPHQIYLSLIDDIHKITSNNVDTLRYFYIAFDIKSKQLYKGIMEELSRKYATPRNRVLNFPQAFPFMTDILNELMNQESDYKSVIEADLMLLLVHLRRFVRSESKSNEAYRIDKKKGMIYNIVSYIDNNILLIKNRSDITERFAFDADYLSKQFKLATGSTLHEYIQQKRLECAKALLIREKKTITQTAELLHYSSIHTFSRAFKNYFGVTPQQFKSQNVEET